MLREIIKALTKPDKDQLLYALEQELTSWVKLPEHKFVGVNIKALPQLTILESQGPWSYGDIKTSRRLEQA